MRMLLKKFLVYWGVWKSDNIKNSCHRIVIYKINEAVSIPTRKSLSALSNSKAPFAAVKAAATAKQARVPIK